MTVREMLKENIGKNIKIGGGTSFIYCGFVDEYSCKLMDYLSELEYKRLQECKKGYQYHLDHFDEIWDGRIKNAMKKADEDKKMTPKKKQKKMEELLTQREKDFPRTQNALNKTIYKIDNFVSFNDRQITKSYKSILEKDVMIFIFDGDVDGLYWDKAECDRSQRMKNILQEIRKGD